VTNSDLDWLLEVEHQYVAINKERGVYIPLSVEEAKGIEKDSNYLIGYPIVRMDKHSS